MSATGAMSQSLPDVRSPRPLCSSQLPHRRGSQSSTATSWSGMMLQDAPPDKVLTSWEILLMGVVLTLGNLALTISKNSRVYLFEQAQCLLYYQAHDSTQISPHGGVDESLCKLDNVQYPLSIVVGIDSCLYLLPALLVLATYEQLLPRVGLRSLILLNLFFSALGVLFSTVVFWTHQPWATYVAPLSFVFDLIGGGEMIRITITSTCIAEVSQPDNLTKTYNYISGNYLLAGVGGAALGFLLLSSHVYALNGLSIACYALTAWIAMFIPSYCGRDFKVVEDSVPPLLPLEDLVPPAAQTQGLGLYPQANLPLSPLRILLHSWHGSYRSLLSLFRTPNPTLTVVLVAFINCLAVNSQVLLPQYTSLVLHWSLATVNALLALKSLVAALILFSLPTIRETFLEPRMSAAHIDLLIAQASIVANLVGVIGLGFSASAGLLIASLCIHTSGAGLLDSLYSYGTISLPREVKVRDFYLQLGLVQTIAGLAGAPLWSGIFGLVLEGGVLPFGLPFWLCAGLYGAQLFCVSALKRWYRNG